MPVAMRGGKVGLFVHIPKTAGTSIEGILKDWTRVSLLNQSVNQSFKVSPQHMLGCEISGLFNHDFFDFIFSVTRHPLDRIKSEYYGHHGNIDDDLSVITKWWEGSLEKYAADPSLYDNHFRPQKDFIVDSSEVEVFDSINIFKLENGLEPIKKYLAENLHIPYGALKSDRRLNQSSKPKHMNWKGLDNKIIDFYAKDMDYFNYE
ncbi:TPA: hypothetical protein NKR25_001848 [Vibrio parahaemolyticus]|uniref:hypothetical protein n=1 Tax=Vibrio atypicus TaxID=558271 RepID=UPI0037369228|nr:hypothetical protein [Vibrio parahaemolyticus]